MKRDNPEISVNKTINSIENMLENQNGSCKNIKNKNVQSIVKQIAEAGLRI